MGGILDDAVGNIVGKVKSDLTYRAGSEISGGAEKAVKGLLNKGEAKGEAPKKPDKCPKCKTPLEPDAKFCPNCSYKLIVTCSKCNVEYPVGTKFCKQCGAAVK